MKKLLTSALALLTATAAYAADEVRLQLQVTNELPELEIVMRYWKSS